jgi:hypothetical protein
VKVFVSRHPYLAAFALLAIAMQGVLYAATRSVSLMPAQYGAVACATILLAGLCVWILTWE